jgi:hypothetical protein
MAIDLFSLLDIESLKPLTDSARREKKDGPQQGNTIPKGYDYEIE